MSRNWTPEEIRAASAAMKEAGEMSFEEFTAAVEATTAAKAKVDAFAKLQRDGVHFCPRCGRMSVKDRLYINALSRHASVYICDDCGMDEAIRDWRGEPLPLKEWVIAQLPLVRKTQKAPQEPLA